MPGSSTTPGRPSACVGALGHIAFHYTDSVGTRNQFSIAAQWLACTFPCRRFADVLADACARLGADVVRYSFIVVDLHHLPLAGLPAHSCKNRVARAAVTRPSASHRQCQAHGVGRQSQPNSLYAHCCDQTARSDDVYDAREIVGEHVQCHLGGHARQRLH
jgi:hypothetical protein